VGYKSKCAGDCFSPALFVCHLPLPVRVGGRVRVDFSWSLCLILIPLFNFWEVRYADQSSPVAWSKMVVLNEFY